MKTKRVITSKSTLSFALLALLLLVASVPPASMHNAPFPPGFNSAAMSIDATSQPETLDPAWANDNAGREMIFNAYETLIFFDPLWSLGPYQLPPPAPQRDESFIPKLASAMPTIDHTGGTNPKSNLPWYSKFTFPIRTGVEFHHGSFPDPDGPGPLMGSTGILTPRDVEYSIERVLVQDRTDGPAWRLYEPLLGVHEAMTPAEDPDWGIKIDGTVEVDGGSVQFYLAVPYSDTSFMQTLCQTWASIMSEAWAANEGDLNMNLVTPIPPSTNPWSNWEYIYNQWHDPLPSFLDDAVDKADPMKDGGTGPYRVSYWTRGVAWSLTRYGTYREGWPAPIRQPVTGPGDRLGGYLNTITWFLAMSWPTRLSDLLAGIRDTVDVPLAYRYQVLGQVVGGEPIRCYGSKFEQAWMRGWYHNPLYTGEYAYHRWKAKTHFGDANWDGLVDLSDKSVLNYHWNGPPPGIGGFNPRADLNGGIGVTTDELTGPIRGISDGRVDMMDMILLLDYWDGPPAGPLHPGGGSTQPPPAITVSVSPPRSIKLVGETFSVDITVSAVQILWGYRFVVRYDTTILTATDCTNLAYLVDPQFTLGGSTINEDEGYVFATFYHSLSGSGFTTTETRPLLSITFTVDAAGTSPIDIDEDESGLVDAGARAWISPYNLNVNDGTAGPPNADINGDGKVNIVDLALVSAHWYPGPPIGPLGYDPDVDINGDGAINMLEVSIISAYWTGPPKGPLDP